MDHSPGDLVTVASGGPVLDGIVFEVPSATKVVVAVVDPTRGPGFRTVHPDTLSAREEEGASDPALRRLIKRTPAPGARGAGRRGGGGGRGGSSGHFRGADHRSNG
jgi:hypothetical protein